MPTRILEDFKEEHRILSPCAWQNKAEMQMGYMSPGSLRVCVPGASVTTMSERHLCALVPTVRLVLPLVSSCQQYPRLSLCVWWGNDMCNQGARDVRHPGNGRIENSTKPDWHWKFPSHMVLILEIHRWVFSLDQTMNQTCWERPKMHMGRWNGRGLVWTHTSVDTFTHLSVCWRISGNTCMVKVYNPNWLTFITPKRSWFQHPHKDALWLEKEHCLEAITAGSSLRGQANSLGINNHPLHVGRYFHWETHSRVYWVQFQDSLRLVDGLMLREIYPIVRMHRHQILIPE